MTGSAGLAAIQSEMARQGADARDSFRRAEPLAADVARSLRDTGRLVLLGMGASHGLNRAVEPIYRAQGIRAVAIPLSEQLDQPLDTAGSTVIIVSQSGESAEVVRWLSEARPDPHAFGLTMDTGSTLARRLPSLVGAGGVETGFAATRSLYVGIALHAAVLGALGVGTEGMLAALADPVPDVAPAVDHLRDVTAIVTSGRQLRGLAESLALGLAELARLPAFAIEGGQLRHGPMEILGPDLGAVVLRGADASGDRVRALAEAVAETGARTVVLDASGEQPAAGCVTLSVGRRDPLAALIALLPVAQHLMLGVASGRVADVGTPLRSQKVTRSE